MKKRTEKEGKKEMAVFAKPSVFEVKIPEKKSEDFYAKIEKARLSKDYIEECVKVSQKLRRGQKK